MKISIFGMGYVGIVSGACLLRDGHEIIGVDSVAEKVADLAQGLSPIQEPEVAGLLGEGYKDGRFIATIEAREALADCQMAWICVGTPSMTNGGIDLSAVKNVTEQIAQTLRDSQARPLIVLRSTCIPGTTVDFVIPLLERVSGLKVGKDIHIVYHPEFLREGSAVEDFDNPPKIVIGEAHQGAGDILLKVYEKYDAPLFRMKLNEAEMVKYSDNLLHALKITFANEVAAVAKSAGLDARRIADVYCTDTKSNISPRYFRPGFAFGGSCLPKDLRAIMRYASIKSLQLPMLESMLESNDIQINELVRRILKYRPGAVGMVGLAFKSNTDDMRESPFVKVARALLDERLQLKIYDPVVQPERLIGSNKQQVQKELHHLEKLLVSSLEKLMETDLIIINQPIVDADCVRQWLAAGIRVLDLTDIRDVDRNTDGYEGIYW
ncbi:MAG: nucleotide sugar dehydrogenase [Planctomycetota bacterium]|jgi:GDP-mannose 6-dehydrogenase